MWEAGGAQVQPVGRAQVWMHEAGEAHVWAREAGRALP